MASRQKNEIGKIIQTPLSDSELLGMHAHSQKNGLVWTAFSPYTSHHHLVLWPEDIWFAILSQFSFYVNTNAEKLRASFVSRGPQGPDPEVGVQ